MKKENVKMYGQDIQIYTINEEETNIEIKGLGDNPEKTFFMRGGELLEGGKRAKLSFYGEGHNDEEQIIVLAAGIDQKQLANIFISVGIREASYIAMDIKGVSIEAPESAPEDKEEAFQELKVSLEQAIEKKTTAKKKPARRKPAKGKDE